MSKLTLSVNDAVTHLVTSNQPVLFCDTCALLDIVGLPARVGTPTIAAQLLTAATSILSDARAGKTCVVLPPLVRDELAKNMADVENQAEQALRKAQNSYDLAMAIQKSRGQDLPSIRIPIGDLIQYLSDLYKGLLDACVELLSDPDVKLRATDRAILCTPPAAKGHGIGDCVIYEHVIAVIDLIRQAGSTGTFVFLTSNAQDFCKSGYPKEPIGTELAQLKATLCTDWDWAYHSLTHQ